MRNIRQGDVWFINAAPVPGGGTVGNEIWSGRPGIIVSNDVINERAGVVQVVYLTTSQTQRTNVTHVPIHVGKRDSIAVCNQVTNIDTSRLASYIGHVTSDELRDVHDGIAFTLGLGGAKPGAALHKWEQYLKEHSIDLYAQQISMSDDTSDTDKRVQGLRMELLRLARERDALITALDTGAGNASMHLRLKKVFDEYAAGITPPAASPSAPHPVPQPHSTHSPTISEKDIHHG